VDAFTNIVRDPRITRNATDTMLDNLTGFGRTAGIEDHRQGQPVFQRPSLSRCRPRMSGTPWPVRWYQGRDSE